MHFVHPQHAVGKHGARLAAVVVFHLVLGLGLVKTMNVTLRSLRAAPAPVTLVPASAPPPLPSPPVDLDVAAPPLPEVTPPPMVAPLPEVTPAPMASTDDTNDRATTVVTGSVAPTQAGSPGATAAAPGLPGAGAGAGAGADAAAAPPRSAAMLDGCVKPAYPAQAARNGDSGTVTIALLVGVDGRVRDARVARSSGFRDLDRAALGALALCTFRPAMQGSAAQAGWTQVAYAWKLE